MIGSINTNATVAIANAQANRDEEHKISARKSKDIEEVTEQNRVAQIKEAIENRDYKIDLRKTSEKMALDLLNV